MAMVDPSGGDLLNTESKTGAPPEHEASPLERRRSDDGALEFLKRAATGEFRIVSSGDLTTMQITEAQCRGLFYIEPGGGLGWALVPWDLTTEKDRKRESEYFAQCP